LYNNTRHVKRNVAAVKELESKPHLESRVGSRKRLAIGTVVKEKERDVFGAEFAGEPPEDTEHCKAVSVFRQNVVHPTTDNRQTPQHPYIQPSQKWLPRPARGKSSSPTVFSALSLTISLPVNSPRRDTLVAMSE
jgi:hypothetical protein